MGSTRSKCGLLALVWFLLAFAPAGLAQDLVKDALGSFPRETVRMEVSRPAELRALANYSSLRQRYVGPRLARLEESLGKLGIREGDVDELALGWQVGARELDFYGLANGRFDPKHVEDRAKASGMSATAVAGRPAYCLGSAGLGTCVVVLTPTRGVFGPLALLPPLLGSRGAQEDSGLGSNVRFVKAIGEAETEAPIWGVAVGAAVVDWFKGWMPAQENLQLDWSRTFEPVEALAYSVRAGDKVEVDVKLDCTSSDAATTLRQVFEGVKTLQQLSWQTQRPTLPNPFAGLELAAQGSQVSLKLTTNFAELENAAPSATP